MERIFVDTDIILDLLTVRQPFYASASALFTLADQKAIEICVSSLCFSNIHYLLCRELTEEKARKQLCKFKILVTVLSVEDKTVESALFSDFRDFEDGIQYFTAIENSIHLLLTRNLKDYKNADIPVMTAEQFLQLRKQ